MRRAVLETGFSLAACALSMLGLMEAWRYNGEGGIMPRGVLILTLFLSALWVIQSLLALRRENPKTISASPAQLRGALMLVVAGIALLFGMQKIGFFTTAAVLVPALAWGLGYREPKGLAIGTVLFLALLIAVFQQLLKVPLPPEIILTPLRD